MVSVMSDWSEGLTRRVGGMIARLRAPHTAAWLSQRTDELGHKVSRTAIAEYETGVRKTIPLADLVVLAQALEVPPLLLAVPGLPDEDLEVVPGVSVPAGAALQWWTADAALPGVVGFATDGEFLRAVRRWIYAQTEAESERTALGLIRAASPSVDHLDPDLVEARLRAAEEAEARLRAEVDRLAPPANPGRGRA